MTKIVQWVSRTRHISLPTLLFYLIGSGFMAIAGETQRPVRIVALGDSLTAGYQLPASQSFPAQLEAALKAQGYRIEVINAGASGDTTADALDRFDWAVPDKADAAIVELGANDALRGLDPVAAKRNLEAIVDKLKAKGMRVLLAGMLAPHNWGEAYARRFDGMYEEIAKDKGVLLYPFFLDGVALKASLTLADGLHPTGPGVTEIVRRIVPMVEELIQQTGVSARS